MKQFTNLHVIQGPCWSSLDHSSFSICAADMSTNMCFLRHKNKLIFVSPVSSLLPASECLTFTGVHELGESHSPTSKSQLSHRTQTLAGTIPVMAMLLLPTFHHNPPSKCPRILTWEKYCFLSLLWILLLVPPVSLTHFSFPCHSSLDNG